MMNNIEEIEMNPTRAPKSKTAARQHAKKLDRLIGKNLQKFRLKKGFTQKQLGDRLGLTFQQIQKYENATNRVSAARLFMLSDILEVPMISFYEDKEPRKASRQDLERLSAEAVEMALEFDRLGKDPLKKALGVILKDLKP